MLEALSPLDGRYESKTASLRPFLSESGLIRYRLHIEIKYLEALTHILEISNMGIEDIVITEKDIERVKEIEKTTNHDVKAVEYLLREKLTSLGREDLIQWIHFALTSQDINNTAFPLMIKEAWETVLYPVLQEIIAIVNQIEEDYMSQALLSRTHGQAASPSTVGKEFAVFRERLNVQLSNLQSIPFSAKFGGATGNFNAHIIAFPDIDWVSFADDFVDSIGLYRQKTTTQIEHYDQLAAHFQALSRINTILIDLCRDIWTYISMDYFKQKIVAGEVGSSTMPHKVNPIDFENAEGNLGIANAVGQHLANKLPISRLQRDLTDSTVLRNVGVPYGHSLIAYRSLLKGLSKLEMNKNKINADLEDNWAVVTEGIQTVLRREGVADAYEQLKSLSRVGKKIDKDSIREFIESLQVDSSIKEELKRITPHNYTGILP